jgi:hypothetical protein
VGGGGRGGEEKEEEDDYFRSGIAQSMGSNRIFVSPIPIFT